MSVPLTELNGNTKYEQHGIRLAYSNVCVPCLCYKLFRLRVRLGGMELDYEK